MKSSNHDICANTQEVSGKSNFNTKQANSKANTDERKTNGELPNADNAHAVSDDFNNTNEDNTGIKTKVKSSSNSSKEDGDTKGVTYCSRQYNDRFRDSKTNKFINLRYTDKQIGLHPVPRFMSTLLFNLIRSIDSNPLEANNISSGFARYLSFFSRTKSNSPKHQFLLTVVNEYLSVNNATERYISLTLATYISERIFALDTLKYLTKKLNELLERSNIDFGTKRTGGFPITINEIAKYLYPIYYTQNVYGRHAYCDIIVDCLSGEFSDSTFEHWNYPENVVATTIVQSNIDVARSRLAVCKQLLTYWSTCYLPVLSACFYCVLGEIYGDDTERMQRDLVSLLQEYDGIIPGITKEMHSVFLDRASEQSNDLTEIYRKERVIFSALVDSIVLELNNADLWYKRSRIDYMLDDESVRSAVLETVMKSRFGPDTLV